MGCVLYLKGFVKAYVAFFTAVYGQGVGVGVFVCRESKAGVGFVVACCNLKACRCNSGENIKAEKLSRGAVILVKLNIGA